MNIATLLASAMIVVVVGGVATAQAGDCKQSGTRTLKARVRSVDRTRWGDLIKIEKTTGDCAVDDISLDGHAPGSCVAGSTATATGKYVMVDMAGLTFEGKKVRCQ